MHFSRTHSRNSFFSSSCSLFASNVQSKWNLALSDSHHQRRRKKSDSAKGEKKKLILFSSCPKGRKRLWFCGPDLSSPVSLGSRRSAGSFRCQSCASSCCLRWKSWGVNNGEKSSSEKKVSHRLRIFACCVPESLVPGFLKPENVGPDQSDSGLVQEPVLEGGDGTDAGRVAVLGKDDLCQRNCCKYRWGWCLGEGGMGAATWMRSKGKRGRRMHKTSVGSVAMNHKVYGWMDDFYQEALYLGGVWRLKVCSVECLIWVAALSACWADSEPA